MLSEDALEQEILSILRSRLPRAEQVAMLIDLFPEPDGPVVDEVWPRQTRCEVERVEAYGLTLGLDANGDACRVEFPYGAEKPC
jgi:hypothetical protein